MAELNLTKRVATVRRSGRTLIQSTVASGVAWGIATLLPSHPRPYFAPIAAVICVSLAIGQQTRRAVEVSAGVAVGVLVGDALIKAVGVGGWQISLGVGLAMTTALLLGGSPLVMIQAASSAVLITALPLDADTAFYARFLDALVGGAVGVTVTLLLPLRPFTVISRAADPLLSTVITELLAAEAALSTGNVDVARRSLERMRATEPLLRQLEQSVAAGVETSRLAPARRGARRPVADLADVAIHLDRVVRNVRVLLRRAIRLIQDDPAGSVAISSAIRPLTDAVECIQAGLADPNARRHARGFALDAARRTDVIRTASDDLSYAVILGTLRSMAVDLLRATGVPEEEALTQIRSAPREEVSHLDPDD